MTVRLSLATEPRFFRGASVQSRLLGLGLRHTVRPMFALWSALPFDIFPPNVLDQFSRLLPVHEGTSWRTVDLGTCTAEWLQAKDVADLDGGNERAILYFHGGAFFTCGLNSHRRLVSRISYASGQPVLNVGYRQMPNEPITESVADGVAAFEWLLEQGYASADITVAGDSAGGYLAFSVARAVIDAGHDRPGGVVALSPLLDIDSAGKLAHPNASRCQVFPARAMRRFAEMTLRMDDRRGLSGSRVCPVDMPVTDLPPTLIQVGSREILLADAEVMANRLAAAGVPCQLHVWDRQVHVFQAAAPWVPEARAAIDEIALFLQQVASGVVRADPVPAEPTFASRVAASRVRAAGR